MLVCVHLFIGGAYLCVKGARCKGEILELTKNAMREDLFRSSEGRLTVPKKNREGRRFFIQMERVGEGKILF